MLIGGGVFFGDSCSGFVFVKVIEAQLLLRSAMHGAHG